MSKVTDWIERMRCACEAWESGKKWINHRCIYGVKNFCNGRANNTGVGKRDKKNEDREPCKYFVNGKCTKRIDESAE